MNRQPRVPLARLGALAALVLVLASVAAAGAGASPPAATAPAQGVRPAAKLPCNLLTPFSSSNFPDPPNVDNQWYPLVPGMQFTMEGRANRGGGPLPHTVIFTVTDLTKVVHGVRTVVLWDQDINDGQLVESELAFQAQDNAGNVWVLGEYPEEYKGGKFSGAPDVWFSGLAKGQAGTLVLGKPQLGQPKFLEAYAPDIILDCGQVSQVGQRVCASQTCYDNVLVIDETSPPEKGIQQKYYAPGVGNFLVGAVNDPEGETLVLVKAEQLSPAGCAAAREQALKLEQHAYEVSNSLYDQTAPAEHTASCAGTPPTPTPPTPTPPQAPSPKRYLPMTVRQLATPTLPPAVFDGCKDDPNPASAPNFPVRIVGVDKLAEVVTLQNVSDRTVSLEDWNMCSISGNQEHDDIFGTLAPGQTRQFPNAGGSPIWDDGQRDDGALYNAAGFIVSYWKDL